MKNISTVFYWVARLLAALILFQTLFFKFTAAEESVFIFTAVGLEPWGRIGIGVLEFVAAILLVLPSTAWLGGLLALGLMMGAISIHVAILGIEVMDDGGYLFSLAIVVTMCALYVLYFNRAVILSIYTRLRKGFS